MVGRLASQSIRPLLLLLAAYVAIAATTQYAYFADTTGYAHNIVVFDQNPKLGAGDFWDFGHLLWRPLGWFLYKIVGGFFPYSRSGEDQLTVTALLICLSMAASLITLLLFRSLAARFLKSAWAAGFVALAFLCFHATLNYLHSGTSYMPGLMWSALALGSMLRAVETQARKYAYLAGAGAGLAILFWLPYAVAIPGIVAASLLWPSPPDSTLRIGERVRLAAASVASACLLAGVFFYLPILQLHLDSPHAVKQWIDSSSHGWDQNRRVLRIFTGLPRSFVWMGDEGMLLKRYLFHDPYAHVTIPNLAGEFWPMLAFYVFAACLVWVLWRDALGQRMLWLLAAATVPLLLFAVFVFEPGSIERYLPLYPFLCLAVAYVLSRGREHQWAVAATLAFLCAVIFLNVKAMWSSSLLAAREPAIARARSLGGKVEPHGLIALLSLRDGLYMLPSHPFDEVVRRAPLPVYDVLEPGNRRAMGWRREFAQRAIAGFAQGCHVWVSKRLLADRPRPEWGWTEGDDPHLHWRDVPPFFSRFHYGAETGGADGFVEMEASADNMKLLDQDRDQSPADKAANSSQ